MHKASLANANVTKGYMAIVIDDFGYNGEGTKEILALNIPLTAAIMPFSENSAENYKEVKASGKDIIVHMPMESLSGKPSWVGDKAVRRNMSDEDIRKVVEEAFEVLPNASGLNNHMGSAIMEDSRSLSIVLEVCREKGCFFLDSMTCANSQGKTLCQKQQVQFLARDVFLDSTDDIEVVKKQLRTASEIALRKGTCISIGHVGPEGGKITAKAIQDLIPELHKKGIEFVTLSKLAEIEQSLQYSIN
ncbi:MAG: divergent polysaccharide deacetylase family protein [Clostridiales bacterium]|nr:divergent polysaccharide deacetylase family protein [Clostridiales bacterium]